MKLKVTDPVNKEGQIVTGNPIYDELFRLSADLDVALEDLSEAGKKEAKTDDVFRRAKAKGIIMCASKGRNAAEREAHADEFFAKERYDAKLAEGMSTAALERVRGRRAQLSAFQTVISAMKHTGESIEFGQVGVDQT